MLQGLFVSKSSDEMPLTLFSDVVLKLSDHSRLMHWLTGHCIMLVFDLPLCYMVLQKGLLNNWLSLHSKLDPVLSGHPVLSRLSLVRCQWCLLNTGFTVHINLCLPQIFGRTVLGIHRELQFRASMNVFSRKVHVTDFLRWAKHFLTGSLCKKTLLWMVKLGRPNLPHRHSICSLGHGFYWSPSSFGVSFWYMKTEVKPQALFYSGLINN